MTDSKLLKAFSADSQDLYRGELFKNRFEALLWLQSRGKISMGKFYQDCKAGLVTIYPDKTVSKFSVAMYAENHFSKFVRQAPQKTLAGTKNIRKGVTPMTEQPTGQPEINASVNVTMESGGITDWSDQDASGTFTVHVRAVVDFKGPDLQAVVDRLSSLDPEQVEAVTAAAVASSLAELMGPGITEGGVYVQD